MSGPETATSDIVGAAHARLRHDSAVKHVTGDAVYVDDMPPLPGTLEIFPVVSPHAHATIVSVDIAEALRAPGVAGIFGAGDIPGKNDIAPIFSDEPILADGLAEYAGQPVLIVAADTYDLGRDAARLIDIGYEVLDPVLTIDEALEKGQFTYPPHSVVRGDAEGAIEAAPRRVSGEVSCGGQDHFYLESQVALAVPGEDRDITVHASTQHPTEVQRGVAHVLGIEINDVLVEVRRMGGAFGGKETQATGIAALAALAAALTGRPAKLRLRRDDDMIVTGKRHDYRFRYEAGFGEDGRLEGVKIEMATRSGNVADCSSGVMARALCHADNCYYLPHVRFDGLPCKTNTVSATAFRGFGGPQGMLAIETVIEHVAAELGKPVDDIRRINYYGDGGRNVTPYGQTVKDNIIVELTERLMREVDFEGRARAVDDFNAANATLKKGIALMPVKFGISFNLPTLNQGGALVHVYTDGSVHLNHGGTEMGQGLFVKVAQVVASTFQIDIGRIKISSTRTDKVPNTSATAASSGSDINGMAAHIAATEIKQRMAKAAADHFGVETGSVEFRANRVYAGNESISFAECAHLAWRARESLSATGFYRTPDISWDAKTMTGSPFYYYTYGACIAEAVIDTLTGESRVLKADILQDVGNSLNPAIDMGQIEGAFVQGMGWLTSEELVWDEDGHLKTHGPSTYKIPGSRDVPPEFNVHILEDAPNMVPTIFRSKAIGEPPLMLAISVWLAIRDAVARTGGRKVFPRLDAPATPEAILMAIEDVRERANQLPSPLTGEG